MYYRRIFLIVAASACAFEVGAGQLIPHLDQTVGPHRAPVQAQDVPPTGGSRPELPYLEPEKLDIAGISSPRLAVAENAGLRDDDIVIGIVAYGESRAYLRSALDYPVENHIVNDLFGSVPVTITHCDRTRCTRVLTDGKPDGNLNIRCGGWLAEQEMALLVNNREYTQSAKEIPLQDLPFVVTTWGRWRKAQPETKVYVGS